MERNFRWHDHLTINIYWLGLNVATGSIGPVILPFLVALFVPGELKNTYLATVNVIGLAVAMLIQPLAGMFSDRSTSRWGRRRPFILAGTMLDLLFLAVIGSSYLFLGAPSDGFFLSLFHVNTAYIVLLAGIILLQFSSNVAHGALQGLIPDLVPEEQRGRASGVKAVMELLPSLLLIGLGPLVDRGLLWAAIGIVMGALFLTMWITVLAVREEPLKERVAGAVRGRALRLLALTALFVAVPQGAVWLVRNSGTFLAEHGATVAQQVALVGLAGLVAMAGSIFLGVYFGAWVGIGEGTRRQRPFIWWVINRLLFLAAVGSVRNSAQYFLKDVLHIPNAATATTMLLAAVALFLILSALAGGYLADGRIPSPRRPPRWFSARFLGFLGAAAATWIIGRLRLHRLGRKKLTGIAGMIAALGTLLLLIAGNVPLVLLCGCIIGTGAGLFMATNWALGTDLVPPEEAGRYLGISNLAGAGAGIVGSGIGGPLADFFNRLQPGLGYLVTFAIYGVLFLLSIAALTRVRNGRPAAS